MASNRLLLNRLQALALLLLLAPTAQAGVICDGVDDFLTGGDVFDLANETFTVEIWLRSTATASNQYVLSKNAAGSGYRIFIGTTGRATAQILNASSEKIAERDAFTVMNDGAAHHLVVVFTTNTTTRDSNTLTLYVDGVLDQGTLDHLGTAAYSTNSVEWYACRRTTTYYAATIKAVTVYDGDIGAAAVARLYAARMHSLALPLTILTRWPLNACGHGASGDGVTFPGRSATLSTPLTGDNGANNTGLTCQGDTFLQHVGVW